MLARHIIICNIIFKGPIPTSTLHYVGFARRCTHSAVFQTSVLVYRNTLIVFSFATSSFAALKIVFRFFPWSRNDYLLPFCNIKQCNFHLFSHMRDFQESLILGYLMSFNVGGHLRLRQDCFGKYYFQGPLRASIRKNLFNYSIASGCAPCSILS